MNVFKFKLFLLLQGPSGIKGDLGNKVYSVVFCIKKMSKIEQKIALKMSGLNNFGRIVIVGR